MTTFRFLHVSDLHISITPRKVGVADVLLSNLQGLPHLSRISSHDPDLLEALAVLAYNRRNEIDAILITGDLATTGEASDITEAYGFVDEAASITKPNWLGANQKPTLQGAGRPIFLIPGNHDRFKGIRCLPGGDEFDNTFSKYWKVKQSAQVLGFLPIKSPELVFIGADFTLRHKSHAKGFGGKWGQGKVYDSVITQLENLTGRIRSINPSIGIIWLAHFPPDFPEGDQALDLLGGDVFIDKALSLNISVILTGHTHNPKRFTTPPISQSYVEILCAGTATQLTAPVGHVVHLLDVETLANGRTKVQRQDLWWNDNYLNFT